MVLVKLAGHCEIATVDEKVCRWERRLEGSCRFAMFLRAERCVVGVADDENSSFDGRTRHGRGCELRCKEECVAWSMVVMVDGCESVAKGVMIEL